MLLSISNLELSFAKFMALFEYTLSSDQLWRSMGRIICNENLKHYNLVKNFRDTIGQFSIEKINQFLEFDCPIYMWAMSCLSLSTLEAVGAFYWKMFFVLFFSAVETNRGKFFFGYQFITQRDSSLLERLAQRLGDFGENILDLNYSMYMAMRNWINLTIKNKDLSWIDQPATFVDSNMPDLLIFLCTQKISRIELLDFKILPKQFQLLHDDPKLTGDLFKRPVRSDKREMNVLKLEGRLSDIPLESKNVDYGVDLIIHEIYLKHPSESLDNPDCFIGVFDQCVESLSNWTSKLDELDELFFNLLYYLWKNDVTSSTYRQPCKRGQACIRACNFIFTHFSGQIDRNAHEEMKQNRRLAFAGAPPVSIVNVELCFTVIAMEGMLDYLFTNLDERRVVLGLTFLWRLLEAYTSSYQAHSPISTLVVHAVSKLCSFVNTEERQFTLLRLLQNNSNLIEQIVGCIRPSVSLPVMLELSISVKDSAGLPSLTLLSQFDFQNWVELCRPSEKIRRNVGKLLTSVLVSLKGSSSRQSVMVREFVINSMTAVFFPNMLEEFLENVLRDSVNIPPSVWENVNLTQYRRLDVERLGSVLKVFSSFFIGKEVFFLFSEWGNHLVPFLRFFSEFVDIVGEKLKQLKERDNNLFRTRYPVLWKDILTPFESLIFAVGYAPLRVASEIVDKFIGLIHSWVAFDSEVVLQVWKVIVIPLCTNEEYFMSSILLFSSLDRLQWATLKFVITDAIISQVLENLLCNTDDIRLKEARFHFVESILNGPIFSFTNASSLVVLFECVLKLCSFLSGSERFFRDGSLVSTLQVMDLLSYQKCLDLSRLQCINSDAFLLGNRQPLGSLLVQIALTGDSSSYPINLSLLKLTRLMTWAVETFADTGEEKYMENDISTLLFIGNDIATYISNATHQYSNQSLDCLVGLIKIFTDLLNAEDDTGQTPANVQSMVSMLCESSFACCLASVAAFSTTMYDVKSMIINIEAVARRSIIYEDAEMKHIDKLSKLASLLTIPQLNELQFFERCLELGCLLTFNIGIRQKLVQRLTSSEIGLWIDQVCKWLSQQRSNWMLTTKIG